MVRGGTVRCGARELHESIALFTYSSREMIVPGSQSERSDLRVEKIHGGDHLNSTEAST